MTCKKIFLISSCLAIAACSSNNINTVIETNTDTSVKLVTSYNSKDLKQYINNQTICKTGTNIEACSTNKQNLANQFNFNVNQITRNHISKINAYSIIYKSPGVDEELRTLSGGILIPDSSINKIKGVVLFYHPTEFTKYNVPSCFTNASDLPGYCQISETKHGSNYAMQLGGVFASQGYVVVMPDYIGQGIDSSIMHPYVINPQVNARSGINMLADTRKLLKHLGLNNAKPLNLFITGYSEGGAYALWASKLLQNSSTDILSINNYNLRMTAPISGAYDISGTQIPMELANVAAYPKADKYKALSLNELTLQKAALMSYSLTSIAYYYFNQKYTTVFNHNYLDCGKYCIIDGLQYKMPELFTLVNPNLTIKNILFAIKGNAFNTINPENKLTYSTKNNSINSFIAKGLNKNKTFIKILKQSDIITWQTNTPVTLIHLDYDSVVSPRNSDIAYEGMLKLSDKSLVKNLSISNFDFKTSILSNDPNNVKPLDHMGDRVFLFIAALNEFNKNSDNITY